MTIKVRRRKPKDGVIRLYLDIYDPKASTKRTSKKLDLFIYENPKGSQKKSNKESLEAAERIRARLTLDLAYKANDLAGLSQQDVSHVDFIEYFRVQADKRFESTNNYANWDSVHKHLQKFCPDGISVSQVDGRWLQDLKHYFKYEARTKSNTRLSQSTLHSYFNKVKACLKIAYNEDLIHRNPGEKVKGFKQGEPKREFLTLEELQAAAKAECDIPKLKTAFMFSALTGMRWSDINKLTWSEVRFSEQDDRWFISFRQKKTQAVETLPISDQARTLLGDREDDDERVFKGLKYSAWHNVKLQQWMLRAGISKTITFHCGRHTYATLLLTAGTDIYTVSKLLGHRELKTTQIYAQIIDQKKIEAANAIPDIEL